MSEQNTVNSVIDRLRVLVEVGRTDRLPPLSVLSQLLNVPERLLLRAARKMRDQGELKFGRGTGIQVIGNEVSDCPEKVGRSSPRRLYLHVKNGILSGKYRSGDRLPKRDHFVVEHHVSSHTVAEALKKLADEQFVHRKGKSWIVGKAPEVRKMPQRNSPIILVIQNKSDTWRSLRNERTGKFVERFASEAQRFGFRLQSFFLTEDNPGNMQPFGSLRNLVAFSGELDHLYFGSIVIGEPDNYKNFGELIRGMVSLRRPVVWFDKSSRTPVPSDLSPYYYHFHFSERDIASSAIKHLVKHGHSHLCYMNTSNAEWAVRRGVYLSEEANRHPDTQFVNVSDLYANLISNGYEGVRTLLSERLRSPSRCLHKAAVFIADEYGHDLGMKGPFSEAAINDVARFFLDEPTMDESRIGKLRNARELLTAFFDESITALIFPRDRAARGYCRAIGFMSIRAPQEISLMSFDNYDDQILFPSDTVDIGADQLGYQAFHAISGIAPIRRNYKDGSVSAVPEVVDRGSVADLDT